MQNSSLQQEEEVPLPQATGLRTQLLLQKVFQLQSSFSGRPLYPQAASLSPNWLISHSQALPYSMHYMVGTNVERST